MQAHQSKIVIASGGAATTTSRRPPMTSKQAKKAYAKANGGPKMSRAERKRIEAVELAAQKKEFERERAQARARAARERKMVKEEAEKLKRKKAGIPEKSRWVRPSQGRITGFLGLGKRGRSDDVDEEEEGDESADGDDELLSTRIAIDEVEEDVDDSVEDVEHTEACDPKPPNTSSYTNTLHDVEEVARDIKEDNYRSPDDGIVATKDSEPALEAQSEAQVQQELEMEVRPQPEVQLELENQVELEYQLMVENQPKLEKRPDLECQSKLDNRLDLESQQKSKYPPEPKGQTKPDRRQELEVQAEREVYREPEVKLLSDYEKSKLPNSSQYLICSQDFLDDSDVLLELTAAQQLLSESFDANKKSLSTAHYLPDYCREKDLEDPGNSPINRTAVHSPELRSCLTFKAKPMPTEFPSSPPHRHQASPMIKTPRPKMEFGCSGVSPELTSSNPFSQAQATLRSVNKVLHRSDIAAIASVMGPPTAPIRRSSTILTSTLTQTKKSPASNVIKGLSQGSAQVSGMDVPGRRRPLGEISNQSQNVSSKFSNYSGPFLKPSLITPGGVPPSGLPTSTQLFLAENLDDFFPSPSQELRELLGDIEDHDIPSNTQVAREIGLENVEVKPTAIELAQSILDENIPWASSQDFIISSQELRDLETPSKAAPMPQSTPWDVRRARKPRFFVEKEEDLLAAAIDESKVQSKLDDEATKLRLENIRIERELLGTRWSSQCHTQPNQDAVRLNGTSNDATGRPGRETHQGSKCIKNTESDYGDEFDDEEAEASMIAYVDKVGIQHASAEHHYSYNYESETESEIEERRRQSLLHMIEEEFYCAFDQDYGGI